METLNRYTINDVTKLNIKTHGSPKFRTLLVTTVGNYATEQKPQAQESIATRKSQSFSRLHLSSPKDFRPTVRTKTTVRVKAVPRSRSSRDLVHDQENISKTSSNLQDDIWKRHSFSNKKLNRNNTTRASVCTSIFSEPVSLPIRRLDKELPKYNSNSRMELKSNTHYKTETNYNSNSIKEAYLVNKSNKDLTNCGNNNQQVLKLPTYKVDVKIVNNTIIPHRKSNVSTLKADSKVSYIFCIYTYIFVTKKLILSIWKSDLEINN